MKRHWRPNLAFVLGGALLGTLLLSFAGLVALRYLGPEMGFRQAATLLALVILAATAVLGWLLWRLLIRPIRGLQTYAAHVRRNPHSAIAPPPHFGTTELLATGQSVTAMAQTLRARESALRSYSDHVTHEIKTPVSALRAAVELLEDGALSPEDRKLVTQMAGATTQIEGQLDALRAAARAREPRYIGQCDLDAIHTELQRTNPTLRIVTEGANTPIPLNVEGLTLVLGHLLQNAASHGATRIELTTQAQSHGLTLDVADDGSGISQGNRSRILDPFFTTRRESGGTGMGLTIVQNILTAHGGALSLLNSVQGTAFRLTFDADPFPTQPE